MELDKKPSKAKTIASGLIPFAFVIAMMVIRPHISTLRSAWRATNVGSCTVVPLANICLLCTQIKLFACVLFLKGRKKRSRISVLVTWSVRL